MIRVLRLEVACLIILTYIMVNYFSAKRRSTITHKIFASALIMSLIQIGFDIGLTIGIYQGKISQFFYRGYIATLVCFLAHIFAYFEEAGKLRGGSAVYKKPYLWSIPAGITMILACVLPIHLSTGDGKYSASGPGLLSFEIGMTVYIVLFIILLIKNVKNIERKDRMTLLVGFVLAVFAFSVQILGRESILTSFAITYVILSMYIAVENPDQLIIEQLQYEKDRANSANVSKSSFIAHVSHEIRTPINAILGMNEMILRESKEEATVSHAQDISNAAYTLYSIINDVLDVSRMDSGKMDIVPAKYDLAQLIYDTISVNKSRIETKQLEFFVEVNPSLPKGYYGDDVRIQQVLSNLLSNAIKYTHEGFVRLIIDGEYHGDFMDLSFQVRDTGIGIKEEDLSKLFVAFERIEESRNRNIEGTGLGINITNNLLRLMGSKLKVNSVYGEGSIFSFCLTQRIVNPEPIGDFEKYSQKQHETSEVGFKAPSVRILVVDDNVLNRRVVSSLLNGTMITIDEAESGYECLSKIRDTQYDIIFLDRMMPDMDGVETVKHIKNSPDNPNRLTPVIMLTADVSGNSQDEFRKSGFDAYLSKPLFSNDLEKIIKAYVPSYKIEIEKTKVEALDFGENWRENLPAIRGIDWGDAQRHLPTRDILYATLKEFHKSIESDARLMEDCFNHLEDSEKLELFRIKVHALKSSAGLIGAEMLSEGARELERAAKESNLELIREKFPYMINYYRTFIDKLAAFDDGEDAQFTNIDFPQVIALAQMVNLEMEEMNIENAQEALDEIKMYEYPNEINMVITQLECAVNNSDLDVVNDLSITLISKFRQLREDIS